MSTLYCHTRHSIQRIQQRKFPIDVVDALLAYGEEEYVPGDVQCFRLTEGSFTQMDDGGMDRSQIEKCIRFKNLAAITDKGVVITVMKRNKIKRSYGKRNKTNRRAI